MKSEKPNQTALEELMESVTPGAEETGDEDALRFPPRLLGASGLYTTRAVGPGLLEEWSETEDGDEIDMAQTDTEELRPMPFPFPHRPLPLRFIEELRLDVDGRYPQMTASGTVPLNRLQKVNWIAKLRRIRGNRWAGGIWYKNPPVSAFAYTKVRIAVHRSPWTSQQRATVIFWGGGLPARIRRFAFKSPYFHRVNFEFDCEQGITPQLAVNTCAHPNHPPLPCERLSIQTVFRRAGFQVGVSGSGGVLSAPGGSWSDGEMHDAMQVYWSRFANAPQWALWVLFAHQHERGPSLGGIMFDDIGPQHRQGTSLFYDSFISDLPAGEPEAYRQRMRFWTAVHEMGHAFNLAHSWQKALGNSWIPLANDPDARSFMNYPFRVAGGQSAFFESFEYRFSNPELLFMRHAPAQFVRMGDAPWFDNHGFQQLNLNAEPTLKLELRFNRGEYDFEFLEPVVAELKLTNIAKQPQIVDRTQFENLERVTIAMVRRGQPARRHVPYARYCENPDPQVLEPGQSIETSVFLSAGLNGLDLLDPGRYVLQAALHLDEGDIVSIPVDIKIAPPRTAEQEILAQDFTDDVGRVLAFDGSSFLQSANDTLQKIVDELGTSRVALHARIALARPLLRSYKELVVPDLPIGVDSVVRSLGLLGTTQEDKDMGIGQARIKSRTAKVPQATKSIEAALAAEPDRAAMTLGHLDYAYYVDDACSVMESAQAEMLRGKARKALKAHGASETALQALAGKQVGMGV